MKQNVLGVVMLAVVTLGCTPLQRRSAGSAVALVGLATASAGAHMLDPCAPYTNAYERYLCRERTRAHDDRQGVQVIAVGLGTVLLGGVIYLTGAKLPKRHPPRAWHFNRSKGR